MQYTPLLTPLPVSALSSKLKIQITEYCCGGIITPQPVVNNFITKFALVCLSVYGVNYMVVKATDWI